MRRLLVCIFVFSALTVTPAQNSPKAASVSEIPTIDYCELIHNPGKYDGKVVRTAVTYRFGFEWSEFYCLNCWDGHHRTWVESGELCSGSEKIKPNGFRGRTVNLQVVGTFYGPVRPGHGHLNAYQYKFIINCIEKAKTIWNDSFVPTALPAGVAKKVGCKADSLNR